MPRRVRKLLNKVGDELITKIQLGRTPVKDILLFSLNFLSAGNFNQKKLELGYDEIYHNYLLITTVRRVETTFFQKLAGSSESNDAYRILKLEKAHRVRLMKPDYPDDFVEVYEIPIDQRRKLTLNRLIDTASAVDQQFFTYDAGNNNMCQTFVENIIDINGLTKNIHDNKTRAALKPQDAKALIATLSSRQDLVKKITDLGANLDTLIFEKKIVWKSKAAKEFLILGNMHVKIVNQTDENSLTELEPNEKNVVLIKPGVETILENTDQIYDSLPVVRGEPASKRLSTVWIVFIVMTILTAIAVPSVYFLWKKYRNTNV